MRARAIWLLVGLGVVTAACGGDDPPPGEPIPSGSVSPSTAAPTSASTTLPAATVSDLASLEAVLATSLGDADLASDALGALGATQQQALLDAAVDDPRFATFEPPRAPVASFDAIVVFAFGNRIGDDGALAAGPVNEELATATAELVAAQPIPVYAQWEVAELLVAAGVPGVVSIEPVVAADGTVTYLSTAGVIDDVRRRAADAGLELERVGVVGFADHATRCVLTVEAAGLSAAVPAEAVLPSTYDAASGQPWTRTRAAYVPTDLVGRVLLAAG